MNKKKLENELERERLKLTACGVVALANTKKSAKRSRKMSKKYKSYSLECVIDAVDREIVYRTALEKIRKEVDKVFVEFEIY